VNYYAAREIADSDGVGTGLYRYTCYNRRIGTFAVGYCAQGCPGHPTKEDACEHQKQYLLDTTLRLDNQMAGMQQQCIVDGCGEWTQKYALVDHTTQYVLCDEHRTREEVAARFSVGETWSSF
jgi:hypothetical protein